MSGGRRRTSGWRGSPGPPRARPASHKRAGSDQSRSSEDITGIHLAYTQTAVHMQTIQTISCLMKTNCTIQIYYCRCKKLVRTIHKQQKKEPSALSNGGWLCLPVPLSHIKLKLGFDRSRATM